MFYGQNGKIYTPTSTSLKPSPNICIFQSWIKAILLEENNLRTEPEDSEYQTPNSSSSSNFKPKSFQIQGGFAQNFIPNI